MTKTPTRKAGPARKQKPFVKKDFDNFVDHMREKGLVLQAQALGLQMPVALNYLTMAIFADLYGGLWLAAFNVRTHNEQEKVNHVTVKVHV